MSITVKKIALPKQAMQTGNTLLADNYLAVIGEVNIDCLVRLGTLTLTIAQLQQLKEGQLLSLAQKTHEPVDIIVNHQVIARGELMSCDEQFAIKITERCA